MLNIVFPTLTFLLGLIVGSFLNVVILRYGTGEGILGRSRCSSCRKIIRWFENIPVLSYLLLFGRCRSCKKALSVQYPLIELATGFIFLAVWLHLSSNVEHLTSNIGTLKTLILPALFYFVVFSLLIIIFVYDLYHKIIPDLFSYSLAGLGFLAVLIQLSWPLQPGDWISLAAGPILFIPFWALWYFSGGTWMGLGDAKLALGMGWILGLIGGISAIVLAFWIGAGVSVLIIFFQRLGTVKLPFIDKNLTMKSEVPFGPFLILGFTAEFFFMVDVLNLSAVLFI